MPTRHLTFLLTDIEGSTRLWESAPDEMDGVLAAHDELLHAVVKEQGGRVFTHTGDGLYAAFETPLSAMRAAARAQLAIARHTWPQNVPITIRVGVHCGEAEVHDGNYFGRPLNAIARLTGAAHGGQILVSGEAIDRAGISPRGPSPIEGTSIADLGVHHLRDLATAMHVHQLSVEGMPSVFPPIRTLESTHGNLPTMLGDLVGRAQEMRDVLAALGTSQLVTLTGFAGAGKTRLALHAAAEASVDFRDGTWVCELAPLSDPGAIDSALASLLRVPQRAGSSLRESTISALIPQCALIVLDNCEHLIDAAAGLARDIIRHCPDVRLIATSLEQLNIAGEAVVPLHPLSLDPATGEATDLSPAVQLFRERAQAASPGFTLTPANRHLAEQICRQLDGLPLAIELTAPRVVSMPLEAINERLRDRFRLLSRGPRTEYERHRTLRNVVEWAYGLLSEAERGLAVRLAVFAGSFDLEAVEAICFEGGDDPYLAAELLEQLVGRSIVSQSIGDEGPRLVMLQTLREYGLDQLAAGEATEAAALQARHTAHFAQRAARAGAGLAGADEARWGRILDADFDNIRAAVTNAVAASDAATGLQIASVMAEYGLWRIRYECADWASNVLDLPGADSDARFPHTAALAGLLIGMRGDIPRAMTILGRGLAAEAAHNLPPSWSLRLALGLASSIAGQAEPARQFHEQAEQIARTSGDPAALALTLAQALNAEANFRDISCDTAKVEEALWIARELQNPTRIAWALAVQSTALRDSEPDRARELARQALEYAQAVDNRYAETSVVTALTLIEARQDGTRESLERLLAVLNSWYEAGNWGQLWPLIRNAAYLLSEIEVTEDLAILVGAEHASAWASGKNEAERSRERRCLAALERAYGAERLGQLFGIGSRMHRDQVYLTARRQLQRQIERAASA